MAELLNTKINGTLTVNDYFNIDENGNLTLNSGNNEIFRVGNDVDLTLKKNGFDLFSVNTSGLNLYIPSTSENEFNNANILNINTDGMVLNRGNLTVNTGELTANKLISANGGLTVTSGDFTSDVELTVNNNITANSLNIISDKDDASSILTVNEEKTELYKPLIAKYKKDEIIVNAKLGSNYNNIYSNNYFDLIDCEDVFSKNDKIEIIETDSNKKLITTIEEKTTNKSFIDLPPSRFYNSYDSGLYESFDNPFNSYLIKGYYKFKEKTNTDDKSYLYISNSAQSEEYKEAYILINLGNISLSKRFNNIKNITDNILEEKTINDKYQVNHLSIYVNNKEKDLNRSGEIFIFDNSNKFNIKSNMGGNYGIYSTCDLMYKYEYPVLITKDYATEFASYLKRLALTIRKLDTYSFVDIQKNDNSIFNINENDINVNRLLTINDDITINTDYSGITINDDICDTLFSDTLKSKPNSNAENVLDDENWYLIPDNKSGAYKEDINLGSKIRINNIIHNVEYRDVYFPYLTEFDYSEFGNFDEMSFKITSREAIDTGYYTLTIKGSITNIFKEDELKKKSVKLTDSFKEKLSGDYIKVNGKFIAKDQTIIENANIDVNYPLNKILTYTPTENNDGANFYSYKKYKAIIFKDNYTYSSNDKIYYKDVANSHNLLNINTRKSNNFLTIKTDNKININGELYENDNRVYTPKTFHLYEALISIDITKTDTTSSKALYKDSNNNDLPFSKVFLRAKRIVPEKMTLENGNEYGIFFKIGDERVTTAVFKDCDLAKSYLLNNDNIMCDIYSIDSEAGNNSPDRYGISYIRYRNVPEIIQLSVVTGISSFDPSFGVTPKREVIKYTPAIETKDYKGMSVANGRLYYLFPWSTSSTGYYSFETTVYSTNTDAEVKFIGSNSEKNANMTLKISIENRQIC